MTSANGRADSVGPPIQLGDFLPERREVVLNGQHYWAWVVTNRRFPRSVQAELDGARTRYMRVMAPLLRSVTADDAEDAHEQAERQRAVDQADVAYARYTTDALMALIPGLGEQDADLIDVDTSNQLLRDLGYFSTAEQPAEQEGRGDAAPLTGDSSPPASPATTRRAARTRSS